MAVILIVEDEVITREAAEMIFQSWGHQTFSAGNVEDAVSLLRSNQPIDALFTDIDLKAEVLGGYEIAYQAIKLRPKLCVIYTTGKSITGDMKALLVEGTHFLCKPYTSQQLKNSVEDLLAA